MTRTTSLLKVRSLAIRYRRLIVIVLHVTLVTLANASAFLLRFDGVPPAPYLAGLVRMLPWLVLIRGLMFMRFGVYQGLWRYSSLWDLMQIVVAVTASSILFLLLLVSPFGPDVYPRSIPIIDAMVLVCLLGGLRLFRRVYKTEFSSKHDKRVLIYGAGDAGELIVRDMKNTSSYDFQPIGFIDDDREKVGRRIHGVPVLGTREDLPKVLADSSIQEVLIAIPTAPPTTIRSIVSALNSYKVRITTLPRFRDLLDGKVAISQIRNVSVEDLLSRAPIGLDPTPVRHLINGRRVLVTGAGGSIGSELSRQILDLAPQKLLLLDRYENSLFAITNDLKDRARPGQIETLVGDVTDAARINAIMTAYRPEIVFHAAAHKHVPLMEHHPCEAVKNNVLGTRTLASAAHEHGVDRFIFVSTDKAVNPTSVMGATKRIGELLLQAQAVGSRTLFIAVRFGNVLGSNGSVVPHFIRQIRAGGPVTVTDPKVERYFMLISEAVQLVLHAAAGGATAGVYVLDMGDQIKIVDMARNIIRLMGHIPDEEIPIRFTGLRPGEKVSEELVWPSERVRPSHTDRVVRAEPAEPASSARLMPQIRELERLAAMEDTAGVRAMLAEIVPVDAPPATNTKTVAVPAPEPVVESSPELGDAGGQFCPVCRSVRVHRSHSRSPWERMRKKFDSRRLFHCQDCDWRGWSALMERPTSVSGQQIGQQDFELPELPRRANESPSTPQSLV